MYFIAPTKEFPYSSFLVHESKQGGCIYKTVFDITLFMNVKLIQTNRQKDQIKCYEFEFTDSNHLDDTPAKSFNDLFTLLQAPKEGQEHHDTDQNQSKKKKHKHHKKLRNGKKTGELK